MQIQFTPVPDEDTAAAILAAIACFMEQDQVDAPPELDSLRSTWRAASVLSAQGLAPARSPARATWSAAVRAEREGRWSYGIVGL